MDNFYQNHPSPPPQRVHPKRYNRMNTPPPIPTNISTTYSKKESLKSPTKKFLAQAGLDLFLSSFAFDGTQANHREPHHPAIAPNLGSIPENNELKHEDARQSQIIVVIGSEAQSDGCPDLLLKSRINKCIHLYNQVVSLYSKVQVNCHCYIIPTGGDTDSSGILQAEVVRNELITAGVQSHYIIMDCVSTDTIENLVRTVPILKHFHISSVHVISSEFHLPRIKTYFDKILHSIPNETYQIMYHGVPDAFTPSQRIEKRNLESALTIQTEGQLNRAVEKIKQDYGPQAFTSSSV